MDIKKYKVSCYGFHVMQGGFGSAILVATAPISVPLLIRLNRQPTPESRPNYELKESSDFGDR